MDRSGGILNGPGPYLARVVNHLDRKFGGALEVELIKFSTTSNTYETDNQLRVVKYASPFYGVTPLRNNETNDGYASSQQSYGFWAVPPDVGSKVLVIFIEGRDDQGFWIACVQDDYMNFMIPDPRASTTLTTPSTPPGLAGKKLPVGEYNKFLANPNNNYPTSQPKPVNLDFVEKLQEQGLIDDDIRGVTSTSARREAPSNVYGMSTPGPLDKRNGAPKNPRGPQGSQANMFSSRLGGHSIVMDDGDETILRIGSAESSPKEYVRFTPGSVTTGDPELPANELFRIRTRTGHQILLHNTEDLIYIGNARGTTWIELTSNGKIDIFSQDSVSLHTQQDLNVTADRDINFFANENINMVAGKELKISSGASTSLKTGEFFAVDSGDNVSFKANTFIAGYAQTSVTLTGSTGAVNLSSGKSTILQSTGDVGIITESSYRINARGDLHLGSEASVYISSSAGDMHMSAKNIQQEASSNFNSKAGGSIYQQASSGSVNIKAGGSINTASSASFNIQSSLIAFDGEKISLNSTDSSPTTGATDSEELVAFGSASAGTPPAPNPQDPIPVKPALMPSRIPQHEPWLQHENLNPNVYTPEYTRAGMQSIDSFTQPLPDTFVPTSGSTIGTTVTGQSYPAGGVPSGYVDQNPEFEDGLEELNRTDLGNPRAIKVFEYFKGVGFTAAQASGIVGNLMVESGITIDHTATGDSGNAYGIAQWNDKGSPDRVANFAKIIGTPLRSSTFEQQLDFIWWELQNESGGKEANTKIRALVDPPDNNLQKLMQIAEQSAAIFDEHYERSHRIHGHRERRESLASSFYVQSTANFDLASNPGLIQSAQTAIDGSNAPGYPNVPSGPVNIIDPGSGNLAMRVVENQGGATRRLPIQEGLKNILNRAAHAASIDQVVVYSGGQPPYPNGPRTGSQRHDNGRAADVYLVVGGRKIDNVTGRGYMEAFITSCVKYGARAIGHANDYMGPSNIHVDVIGAWGSGQLITWGAGGSSSTRLQWVDAAARRGLL
jgi:uncharacterized protein (DUF2345 family)